MSKVTSEPTFDFGDLFIALAQSNELNESRLRVFLFLFSRFMIGTKNTDNSIGPSGTGFLVISDEEASKELGIEVFEYQDAINFLQQNNIIQGYLFEDDHYMWFLKNADEWTLAALGENIKYAKSQSPIKVAVGGCETDQEFREFVGEVEQRLKGNEGSSKDRKLP